MGAWQAWLNFLKRLRESERVRNETHVAVIEARNRKDTTPAASHWQDSQVMHEPSPIDESWRVPYEDKTHDDDLKGWKGQGLVEYSLMVVLVATVAIVLFAMVTIKSTPPEINASLLEVVRWCESHARDTSTSTGVIFAGDQSFVSTTTHSTDNADKFIVCMRGYEYEVTR